MDNVLNLDSKILRSFKKIWNPGQLTIEYVSGIRNKNLNQWRFFISVLVLHVAVLAYALKDVKFSGISTNFATDVAKSKLKRSFDEESQIYKDLCNDAALDSIRKHVFKGIPYPEEDTLDFVITSSERLSSLSTLTKQDIIESSPDSIFQQHNITEFSDQLTVKQMFKAFKNPDGVISAIIGNILWLGVIMILFGALFLKILYIRRKKYFVEHVSILINFQIFAWLVVSMVLIFNIIWGNKIVDGKLFIAAFISLSYLFLSMKRYYQQGWFKTFIKFIMLCLAYSMVFFAAAGLISVISFYLF